VSNSIANKSARASESKPAASLVADDFCPFWNVKLDLCKTSLLLCRSTIININKGASERTSKNR